MKESLAGRVGRLVSASVNAAVDAVENLNPAMVMEQTLREIDSAIDEVRGEIGRAIAQKHLASKRLLEENARHTSLVEKIEFAVQQGRDDLAEAGISTQMDIEARLPILETTVSEAAARELELNHYLNALQSKKRDMAAELKHFREEQAKSQTVAVDGNARDAVGNKVEKAAQTFDRVMERATGVSAGPRQENMKNAAQLAELEELARANRIKERLAAIKANQ